MRFSIRWHISNFCFINVIMTLHKSQKFKTRIYFLFFICISTAVFAQNVTELELKDGANRYESEAIASAMSEMISEDFKIYFSESHFPYGPRCNSNEKCRQNLQFSVKFDTASVDLNNDGISEVIVRYDGPNRCGSGGCTSYILEGDVGGWISIGSFFPGGQVQVSSEMTNGNYDIYYFSKTERYSCKFDGFFYQC